MKSLKEKLEIIFRNEDKIEYKIGNAQDIIPTLNETFDLVFIDADKRIIAIIMTW